MEERREDVCCNKGKENGNVLKDRVNEVREKGKYKNKDEDDRGTKRAGA